MGSSSLVIRGLSEPAVLEAIACREALALATDLGIYRLHIASDCQTVVKDIHEGSGAAYGVIIKEIQDWKNSFSACNFVFERRSCNSEAHNLARYSLSLDQGRHIWLGHPHDPATILVNLIPE